MVTDSGGISGMVLSAPDSGRQLPFGLCLAFCLWVQLYIRLNIKTKLKSLFINLAKNLAEKKKNKIYAWLNHAFFIHFLIVYINF